MSHKSKRQAGRQFASRPRHKVRFPGSAEDNCPWWDADWWEHCDMESLHVDAPTPTPAPQPVTLLAPVPQPLLLAEWSVTTLPLRKAAVRKENDGMRIKIVEGDKFPVPLAIVRDRADYEHTMKVYNARCDAAKALKAASDACLKANGSENHAELQQAVECAKAVKNVTQTIWDHASGDSVNATRQPCPALS